MKKLLILLAVLLGLVGPASGLPSAGRMRLAGLAPLPAVQVVAFGGDTQTGYGADLLGYTGTAGTFQLISQVDQDGATITLFQLSQRALSWRGATATYGSAGPVSTNCGSVGCTVIIKDTEPDGRIYFTTVKIPVIAGASMVREMAGVAAGGRWVTDSIYTIDGTTGSGASQFRTLLTPAKVPCGEIVYARSGSFDPSASGLRVRPLTAWACAPGTRVTIRSIVADTSLGPYGLPARQHGFKLVGGFTLDTGTTGDIEYPIDLVDVWFQPGAALTFCARYTGANGYGVSYYNTRCDGLANSAPQNIGGIEVRSGATVVATADNNLVAYVGKAIVVSNSTVLGRFAVVSTNDGEFLYEDMVNDVAEGTIVHDNLLHDALTAVAGDHPDFYQNGTLTAGAFGPTLYNNIAVYNSDLSTETQQSFFIRHPSVLTTSANIHHNLTITLRANGVYVGSTNDPIDRCNTTIAMTVTAGLETPPKNIMNFVPGGEGGTGGIFNYNLANTVDSSGQTSPVTTTPNYQIGNTTAAVLAVFPNFAQTGNYSRARVRFILTPLAGGPAMNLDGTYNGALDASGNLNPACPLS